jgi:type IV pilus assembly protein PilC
MKAYQYEIRDSSGNTDCGVIEARTLQEATDLVQTQGDLLSLVPVHGKATNILDLLRSVQVGGGPSNKDVMMFTTQLAVMVKAGLNLRDCLRGISDRMVKGKFRDILQEVTAGVESGRPFSSMLAQFPLAFSPMYVHLVRAAELSGTMGHMLERISQYLNQQNETKSMVRGAMVYPAIIFTMAVGATIFLLAFALPKFSTIFQGKEALLPKPTVILLATSAFMRDHWMILLAVVLGGIFVFRLLVRSGRVRPYWDAIKLRLPIVGTMCDAVNISQALRAMGELIGAGAAVLDAIMITADLSGNTLHKRMWLCVHDRVKEGNKIAKSLADQSLMPPNVVQMISAGEESGSLSEVLGYISEYYAGVLKNTIKTLTTILEPAMILIMGLVVGFIAMSVLLPIFKMSNLVK